MKTDAQKKRDEKNGIVNMSHCFDANTGKIVGTGEIKQEINPENIVESLPPLKEKIVEMERQIESLKEQEKSCPSRCSGEIKRFLKTQKDAAAFMRGEGMRANIKAREEELEILKDDLSEQTALAEQYLKWKAK
jgi:hypothetical protein